MSAKGAAAGKVAASTFARAVASGTQALCAICSFARLRISHRFVERSNSLQLERSSMLTDRFDRARGRFGIMAALLTNFGKRLPGQLADELQEIVEAERADPR